MELQLGLALPANNDRLPHWLHSNNKKPDEEEEESGRSERDRFPRTLALFHWDTQQPDEEDHHSVNTAFSSNKVEGLIGWPPIKTHRRKLVNYNQYHRNYNVATRGDHAPGRRRVLPVLANSKYNYNSKYVKVKMEGVGIARKIDLTLYPSLATLKRALFAMFGRENFGCYELTYQDSEGYWRLAEDNVSWRNFMGSVQRIKLVKSNTV